MSEIASSVWSESKGFRRLAYAACVAELILLCALALDESMSWVGWAVAGVAVVGLLVMRWPYGLLFFLIAASVMPRFFVEIFGWKARPEHFAAAVAAGAVTVWLGSSKLRIRLSIPDYCVLAYVVINFVSSAVGSPAPAETLRWALQNSLAVLSYFIIRFLVQDVPMLEKALRIFLGIAIAESMYGILCSALHYTFGTMIGMDWQYFVDVAAPYGTLYEPNLFGAYTACCAVLYLSLYLGNGGHRVACMAGFVVASLATFLSFSRAALVALIFAVIWTVRKTRQPNTRQRWRVMILVPVIALLLLVIATPIRAVLQERFANLFSEGLAEETTITRYILIAEALQDVPNHPLLGSGTASFQLSFDWAKYVPQWAGSTTWVGNSIVRIVHDTGFVGLAFILGFLISVWRDVRQSLYRWTKKTPILLGLWAGTLLYCISYQSTDGTLLAFTWVHLGFLASSAILMKGATLNSGSSTAAARSTLGGAAFQEPEL